MFFVLDIEEKYFFMIPIKKAGIKQDENSLRLTLPKGIIFSLVGEGYTSQLVQLVRHLINLKVGIMCVNVATKLIEI